MLININLNTVVPEDLQGLPQNVVKPHLIARRTTGVVNDMLPLAKLIIDSCTDPQLKDECMRAHERLKRIGKAIEQAVVAHEIYPESNYPHYQLARMLESNDAAAAALLKASPGNPSVIAQHAAIKQSIEALRPAMNEAPGNGSITPFTRTDNTISEYNHYTYYFNNYFQIRSQR